MRTFSALSCLALAINAAANGIVWTVTNLYEPASESGAVDKSRTDTKSGEGDVKLDVFEITAGAGGWKLWQSGEPLTKEILNRADDAAFRFLGSAESDASGSVSVTIDPTLWSSQNNYYIALFFTTVSDVDGEKREWHTAYKPDAGNILNPSPYRTSDGNQTLDFTTMKDNTYNPLPWYAGEVVPEPGTAALALAGLALLFKRRK